MNKKRLALVIALFAALIGAVAVAAAPDVEVMRILRGTLTPAQLRILLDARKAHIAEMQARFADQPDPVQIWRNLDLAEDQQDKLLDVAAMNVDELALAGQQVQADGAALRRAVFTGNPDNPAIKTATDQLGLDLGDAAVLAADALEDARSALTPAQVKLLEDQKALHDRHLSEFLNNMPARVEELVTLWNKLALSPQQMDALQEIHRIMPGIMRRRHQQDQAQFRADLSAILTPAQLVLADQFRAQMKAEHKGGRGLAMRQKLEADLALTGSQRISLVNMLIARRDSLEQAGLLLVAAGLDLRDKVLAAPVDEAAIRESAGNFATVLASVSSLGAQLVTDARKILTPKQFGVIAAAADRRDQAIARHIGQAPARVHAAIGFADQLALTPVQKSAIADLIEKRHAERRARFMAQGR